MDEQSADYWFKVVGMLQHNWAVLTIGTEGECLIQFFSDTGGVFDSLSYETRAEAEDGLRRNGFERYADDQEAQRFIAKPTDPLHPRSHPNGDIYSSGRHWKS